MTWPSPGIQIGSCIRMTPGATEPALAWPGLLLAGLVAPAGAWAVARGVLEIIVAMHLRKVIDDEWVLALSGILSIAFGALLLAKPMEGALVIGVIIGCFLFVYGLAAILFSLRLRTLGNRLRGA